MNYLPWFMNIYLEEKLFRVRLCMFNVKRTFETFNVQF